MINTNIIYIQRDIADIKLSLKDAYATKDQVQDIEREVQEIKRQSNLWRWLSPTLTAVFSSVFTFLVIEYFISIHR